MLKEPLRTTLANSLSWFCMLSLLLANSYMIRSQRTYVEALEKLNRVNAIDITTRSRQIERMDKLLQQDYVIQASSRQYWLDSLEICSEEAEQW